MRLAYSKRSGDLHPKAPLFITKVCVFGFCNPWSGFGQAPSHCLLHKQLPFEMLLAHKLNEAQLCRVLHYCRSRRHPLRNTTIFLVSFYAGLRAKEIAALNLSNVFDEAGNVREQFILGAEQSKCRQRRTVYLNQRLRKALANYAKSKCLRELNRPLFESQKGGHFSANTMCQLFLNIYKAVGLKYASSHSGRRT